MRDRDLLVVDFILLLLVIIIIFEIKTRLRIIFGLASVLFFPGYTLTAALFPGKKEIDSIERAALSFGTSIAVSPLLGLMLNYTPFGIRLVPVLLTLSIFTLAMSFIAHARRKRLPESERFSVQFNEALASLKGSFELQGRGEKALSVLLVLSILAALGMLYYVISTPKTGEKFTEFYILGKGGKAADYPARLKFGEEAEVTVGVANNEYANITYTFEARLQNETIETREVNLAHNQSVEFPFKFKALRKGESMKMEFFLYKNKTSAPYRELHLWIDVE